MYFLDFLNESPKLYIFQKETNKTHFGGILFLIYIIIMIFISLLYILDYAFNEKYTYESYTFYNHTDDKEELSKMKKDNNLNPLLNITINITNENFSFVELNHEFGKKFQTNKKWNSLANFERRVDDINILAFYKCGEDENCFSFKKMLESNESLGFSFGDIYVENPDYSINHYGNPPVDETKSKKTLINLLFWRHSLNIKGIIYEWETIRYKDQKSFFNFLTDI